MLLAFLFFVVSCRLQSTSSGRLLDMASKPLVLPETFQGTESWEDWIEHFERVAAVNEWTSNASKLKWLKVRLTGKAAAALKRFSEATRNDYAALKEALQKRFEPASKKELYMAEFQIRRKRKDEDWASFGDSLRFLAEKSYPGTYETRNGTERNGINWGAR